MKKCCKQCRHVKLKGTMTKKFMQKQTARNTQNNKTQQTFKINYCLLVLFSFIDLLYVLKNLQEMLSYRLSTVNDLHLEVKTSFKL